MVRKQNIKCFRESGLDVAYLGISLGGRGRIVGILAIFALLFP